MFKIIMKLLWYYIYRVFEHIGYKVSEAKEYTNTMGNHTAMPVVLKAKDTMKHAG